jgi:triacylglycerol lipase
MRAIADPAARPTPVLLVHGLWDTAGRLAPLVEGLRARGIEPLATVDIPNHGGVPFEQLGELVRARADALLAEHGARQLDLVGFSMGALACRYYLQRCGGRDRTRRFVSISGPHRGTLTAYSLPLAGIRQMRPGSALLADLERDPAPFGDVAVHCVYTPYDLMIVPATSSVLPGALSVHRIPVPVHRWMIRDPRVHDTVAQLLVG